MAASSFESFGKVASSFESFGKAASSQRIPLLPAVRRASNWRRPEQGRRREEEADRTEEEYFLGRNASVYIQLVR